jgi:hypothetical protein
MAYPFGKRPRQQLIKCWECEGDHLYRFFPHKGERMRSIHNIQEAQKMKDMQGKHAKDICILGKQESRISMIPHD